MKTVHLLACAAAGVALPAAAYATFFSFDDVGAHTPLPITITADDLTAHITGSGQSFSIQNANVLGFTPAGFSGNCIYPDSVFLADLLISFSSPISDFSILYAPEEYACDSSAEMKVTAYLGAASIGFATTTIDPPGTWPTGTLAYSSAIPFDSVVIHYNHAPPTGGDWGPIFMADNMIVTPAPETSSLALLAAATTPLLAKRRRSQGPKPHSSSS